MGHTRHRRKASKTQHEIEHPESLTTWDTQDTGGRQAKHNTNGTSRITDNMGHTRHRRKASKTQHGMEHPESLTTWDTEDTGGMQTKHNTEWNIQSH
jgi:hypothetical protein